MLHNDVSKKPSHSLKIKVKIQGQILHPGAYFLRSLEDAISGDF
jgi:hypothetical protein